VVGDCWWDKWQPTVSRVEMGAESCMPKCTSTFRVIDQAWWLQVTWMLRMCYSFPRSLIGKNSWIEHLNHSIWQMSFLTVAALST
jgi:hypothetical protein